MDDSKHSKHNLGFMQFGSLLSYHFVFCSSQLVCAFRVSFLVDQWPHSLIENHAICGRRRSGAFWN